MKSMALSPNGQQLASAFVYGKLYLLYVSPENAVGSSSTRSFLIERAMFRTDRSISVVQSESSDGLIDGAIWGIGEM